MVKRLVTKCVDCGNGLKKNPRKNLHHFRCDRCWLKYMQDFDKHKCNDCYVPAEEGEVE